MYLCVLNLTLRDLEDSFKTVTDHVITEMFTVCTNFSLLIYIKNTDTLLAFARNVFCFGMFLVSHNNM